MLATARGYYDGSHIVLTPPVAFERGQEVIVTYSVPSRAKKDVFYSESNMRAIDKSLEELRDGKVVVKTFEELEALEK